MNDHPEEMISIMLDSELDAAETEKVISALGSNPRYRYRLERYQLISDTIKHQLPDLLNHNLALRVTQAIADEQVHSTNVRQLSEPLHSGWRVTGFALAASLAAMAVIGVQWYQPDSSLTPEQLASATAPVMAPATVEFGTLPSISTTADSVQLVSAGQSVVRSPEVLAQVASGDAAQWKVLRATSRPRLTEYLINHNEYSSIVPVRDGLMPQVRIVGYDSGE
ncbi:MAG: sigma-E factor negative regulatory protein RseA [Gammaproteobacteria bacterium]|nr:MAG: sigma-E factor negative regulatory protein RseA [Gammaproteobacteria bacterium]TND06928.1 MAG: sigma-E factor negative regulatory protein RseA [Gammaproteobacteria bacterium]